MDPTIQCICLVESEGPEDIVFEPSGIVIALSNHKFSLYSNSSDHNRLRGILAKVDWRELYKGMRVRDTEYRLTELTDQMTQQGWSTASTIPAILRHLYTTQPRHLFFLKRYANLNP